LLRQMHNRVLDFGKSGAIRSATCIAIVP
jgi:hypothetical protein